MKIFKAKPLFCAECGVCYQPVPPEDERGFANLCQPHRTAAIALKARKDAVASWAATHWEVLEPLANITSARYGPYQAFMARGGQL